MLGEKAALNSLYCTTSETTAGTGAGIVSQNEIAALKEVSNVKLILSHNEIAPKKHGLPNNPFLYDYLAASLIHEPINLAHLYSDPFGITCDKIRKLNPDTLIVATCAAHNLEASVEEFNRLGFEYPFKHMTDPFLWALYSKHLKDANVVVCPSQLGAKYIKRKVGIKNVVVIPHGVDIPAESKITSLPDKFAVAYLGAVGPDKGLIYLLKAWSSLNYPDAKLILAGLAGSNQMKLYIKQVAAGGDFKLVGYVPDVSTVYNSCSVYIQSSVTEGWGIEVLEAMSYGRPVIVSKGAGSSDCVTDGEDGFVVPPRDSDAIAMKIDYLKNNPDELKRIAENARAKAMQYDWHVIRAKYVDTYKRVLET